jgi:zinc transport system ATP-binding protein
MHDLKNTTAIIDIKNVYFSYDDKNFILDDISLTVHRGDYLAIIGPNGAGKTTLLKVVLKLLKSSRGTVELFGQDISSYKEWSRLSYVPQKATDFDPNFPATVQEVVLMGRYAKRGLFHGPRAADYEVVKQMLQRVEMLNYRDHQIGDLSGGQQQRVFLARALAAEPEIIFLDEPTAGLDSSTTAEFYALLKKLNIEFNLTLVLITHDIDIVAQEAMHVACINRKLEYFGSVADFLKTDHQHVRDIGGVKILDYHKSLAD